MPISAQQLNQTEGQALLSSYGIRIHGEKFGRTAHPTRRTVALNTRRTAWPLSRQTALPLWENHCHKQGELLRETLVPAVLSKALLPVWGNQCPNLGVDVILNQRGVALPPLVLWFNWTSLRVEDMRKAISYGCFLTEYLAELENLEPVGSKKGEKRSICWEGDCFGFLERERNTPNWLSWKGEKHQWGVLRVPFGQIE